MSLRASPPRAARRRGARGGGGGRSGGAPARRDGNAGECAGGGSAAGRWGVRSLLVPPRSAPLVAGGLGEGTGLDPSGRPPVVTVVEYMLDGPRFGRSHGAVPGVPRERDADGAAR